MKKIIIYGLLLPGICAAVLLSLIYYFEKERIQSTFLEDSIADSKAHGLFVCAVQAQPAVLQWKGVNYSIHEAWLQRQGSSMLGALEGSHAPEHSSGQVLCFTLRARDEPYRNPASSGLVGSMDLYDKILSTETLNQHSAKIMLETSGPSNRIEAFRFSW